MSLNRTEAQLFDYLQRHPEERQFILYKVRECAKAPSNDQAANLLTDELSQYYKERCQVVGDFSSAPLLAGAAKLSLRNLSEYLLRVWGPVRSKKAIEEPKPLPKK